MRSGGVLILALIMGGTYSAVAQRYSQLDGAWIHARFIAALKTTASLDSSFHTVSSSQPLWIEIDSSNLDGSVRVSFTGRDTVQWILRRVPRMDSTLQWAIGPEDGPQAGPQWWLSLDEQGGTYVALSSVINPSSEPVVYGKLPSQRQEATFIIQRMAYAALLVGRYHDATQQPYEFLPSMTGSWKGAQIRTSMRIGEDRRPVVTLEYANRHRESYYVQRRGTTVELTSTEPGPPRVITLTARH